MEALRPDAHQGQSPLFLHRHSTDTSQPEAVRPEATPHPVWPGCSPAIRVIMYQNGRHACGPTVERARSPTPGSLRSLTHLVAAHPLGSRWRWGGNTAPIAPSSAGLCSQCLPCARGGGSGDYQTNDNGATEVTSSSEGITGRKRRGSVPRLLSWQTAVAAFASPTCGPNPRPNYAGHRRVTRPHVLDIGPALAG